MERLNRHWKKGVFGCCHPPYNPPVNRFSPLFLTTDPQPNLLSGSFSLESPVIQLRPCLFRLLISVVLILSSPKVSFSSGYLGHCFSFVLLSLSRSSSLCSLSNISDCRPVQSVRTDCSRPNLLFVRHLSFVPSRTHERFFTIVRLFPTVQVSSLPLFGYAKVYSFLSFSLVNEAYRFQSPNSLIDLSAGGGFSEPPNLTSLEDKTHCVPWTPKEKLRAS